MLKHLKIPNISTERTAVITANVLTLVPRSKGWCFHNVQLLCCVLQYIYC